jgi:hypothetical protein
MVDFFDSQTYIQVKYPELQQRYRGAIIDLAIQIFLSLIIIGLGQIMTEPLYFLIPFLVLLWGGYEPLLSCWSGTVGQRMMEIRVRDGYDPFRPISLSQSYIRFFTKYLLWWASFITISRNEQFLAIHDRASVTVMVSVQNSSDN